MPRDDNTNIDCDNLKEEPPVCGKLIRTYEGLMMPCKRKKGHEAGCNPFSA